jgi:hypothetical protein
MFAQLSQKRRLLVLAAAIGSGLLWSGIGLPLAVQAQAPDPSTQLYVDGMGVGYKSVGGPKRLAVATVDIVDGNGQRVNGALVVGDWSGCFKQLNDSDVTETVSWTDSDGTLISVVGRAQVWANKSYSCWGSGKHCSFTFTITSVSKAGMTYVPVAGKTTASTPCN